MLKLRDLDAAVLLLYHLMKEALLRIDLPLSQETPVAYLVGYFGMMNLFCRGIGGVQYILSWYRIQTGSHGFPSPFGDLDTTMATDMSTI